MQNIAQVYVLIIQTGTSIAAVLDTFLNLVFAAYFLSPREREPSGIAAITDHPRLRNTAHA